MLQQALELSAMTHLLCASYSCPFINFHSGSALGTLRNSQYSQWVYLYGNSLQQFVAQDNSEDRRKNLFLHQSFSPETDWYIMHPYLIHSRMFLSFCNAINFTRKQSVSRKNRLHLAQEKNSWPHPVFLNALPVETVALSERRCTTIPTGFHQPWQTGAFQAIWFLRNTF